MIWHYFPIGMRFPVKDFSDETKRRCWETALKAIYTTDPNGTVLYEACEAFDPGSGMPVYTCIVCYEGIKQSRASGKCFHGLSALTARLALHEPFVQANYLESFGPYPELAKIDGNGAITVSESAPFIPSERMRPFETSTELSLLIAADESDEPAETALRTLGAAAADRGFSVRRTAIADGGKGTVRALVSNRKGRYETIAYTDENGERRSVTIGVLPGSIAVVETGGDPCPFGTLITKTLDLGYRRILLASDDPDGCESLLKDGSDPRLSQSEITALRDAETVLDMIRFEAASEKADVVIVKAASADKAAVNAALARLREGRKPTVLLSETPAEHPDRLMSEYPQLRGVITLNGATGDDALKDALQNDILPLAGKAVAKNGGV